MNAKKGMHRAIFAIVVLYFIFWGIVFWGASENHLYALQQLGKLDFNHPEAKFWAERVISQAWWIEAAVNFGLFPAIGLVVLSPVLWWIYKGFYPKDMTR